MTHVDRMAERLLRAAYPGRSGNLWQSLAEQARPMWLRIAEEALRIEAAAARSVNPPLPREPVAERIIGAAVPS